MRQRISTIDVNVAGYLRHQHGHLTWLHQNGAGPEARPNIALDLRSAREVQKLDHAAIAADRRNVEPAHILRRPEQQL